MQTQESLTPVPPPAPAAAVSEAPAPEAQGAETMAGALGTTGTAITMKQLLEAGVHFGHQTKR
ncbi:MAG TPA: hypothetical protein VLS93_05540, partial [Anaeromyxobacteraceae bacterium]|nr:hypothetical protein [Anaeromyxobacteraceae bacterium]